MAPGILVWVVLGVLAGGEALFQCLRELGDILEVVDILHNKPGNRVLLGGISGFHGGFGCRWSLARAHAQVSCRRQMDNKNNATMHIKCSSDSVRVEMLVDTASKPIGPTWVR